MADPTAAKEQKNPAVNLTSEESKLFSQVFQAADSDRLGVVTGDIALSFFPQKTRLPVDVLGEIWQIADVEDKGFLTPNGFYIVLRLIGYAQAGKPITAESALRPGPIPKFDGINGVSGGTQISAPPLQAQGSGGPIRVPPLSPEKASQCASLFEESGAQNGLLPGTTAKQIFDRAQLPNDILVRIWNLADTEMRGMLSCTEFIIAMHLLTSFRNGSMRALPQSLPAGLYEAAARRGAPTRPGSVSKSGPSSPLTSNIARQATGGPLRTTSPLATQSHTAPLLASQITNTSAANGWVVTATEKVKYDNQFAKLDVSGMGYVSGDEAVGFFSKSGLPENDLAQIWDLADILSEGRLNRDEFAVAMHLIVQTVQSGAPIPSVLPDTLIPPSMRGAADTNQKTTAPNFQQPQATTAPKQAQSAAEDLFGLDALSAPPAAPEVTPQAPQQTGGSSGFPTPPSPPGKDSPVATGKSQASTSIFKPFQPSSSFGQSMVTPQATGPSASLPNRGLTNDDLLSGDDEASTAVDDESINLGNLSNQINILAAQTVEVKAKRSAVEHTLGQTTAKKQELETKLAEMRRAYQQEARDVRSIEDNLLDTRNENQKLQQDLAMLQHTQQNLSEEHQKVAQQLFDDQQENTKLKEQISQVNGDISLLKPQVEKAKSEARQQKGLVAINKKQLSASEADRDKVKAELDEAFKEHADATKELADIQGQSEALTQETQKHSQNLDMIRATAQSQNQAQSDVISKEMNEEPLASSPAMSKVASPAASVNNLNPFFKRSNTGLSPRQANETLPGDTAKHPNHSAFDDFFGPAMRVSSTPTPPLAAPFGAPAHLTDASSLSRTETLPESEAAHGSETRPRVPPSPPRSRQVSSAESASKASQEDFSGRPNAHITGSGIDTDKANDLHSIGPEAPKASQPPDGREMDHIDTDTDTDTPVLARTSKDLPGAFPDETPLQSPNNTGPGVIGGPKPSSRNTSNDPFASNTMTPTSARDDFESAFAGFDKSQGNVDPSFPSVQEAKPLKTSHVAEFPPIQHFENDDSESESESDAGFKDSFVPVALMPSSQDNKTAMSLPPNQQGHPRVDDVKTHASVGSDQNPADFPAEHRGLPAREDSASIDEGIDTTSIVAIGQHGSKNSASKLGRPARPVSGFDDFDSDFADLSEAQAADDLAGDDLNATITSRREAFDEFNPNFDSPAPSTRATTSVISPDSNNSNIAAGGFADFESNVLSKSSEQDRTHPPDISSQAPSSHEWDSMFAGLNNPQSTKGTRDVDRFFRSTSPTSDTLPTEKPTLARAISDGTEHDDPILKNLTGMGFSREESLKALEKFDYNISKAADYLTSKP